MDTPVASNKSPPRESSPRDPVGNKEHSDAQIAAMKLDDRIDGARKDAAGRRLERQQSRRTSFFPSQRNLSDTSPSVAVRKLSPRRTIESANPPTDSSQASQVGDKEPSGNRETSRMSKTSENLQRDLDAKARARGLRSSSSVRNLAASSPSLHNVVGAKKAPPSTPTSAANLKQPPHPPGPSRLMSRGDFQPSRIPHFSPCRLQGSQVELEMGELNNRSSTTGLDTAALSTGKSDDTKRPGLLSHSNSVQKLPAPSFRRKNFTRESSMTVLRRTATSNSREDLDQLIAYKTGIPLENPNQEDDDEITGEKKAPAVASAPNQDATEESGEFPQSPRTSYAAAAAPRPPTGSFSGLTNNRDLDELIAYKTGIPLDETPGEKETGDVELVQAKGRLNKTGDCSNHDAKLPIDGKETSPSAGSPGGLAEDWFEQEEELAVAFEVQEDMDDDVFVPGAIQYDPDAKTPMYNKRRYFVYCMLLFGLAVVLLAGAQAFAQSRSEPHIRDDESPREYTRAQAIKSIIEKVTGQEVLETLDSPYAAALDWIANEDKLQVGVEEPLRLIQRYVLALFSFQTSNWYSCGAANETLREDQDGCLYQELVSIFPHRYRSVPSFRWLSSKHECEWAGIFCGHLEKVRTITLVAQNIRGKLPNEFKELEALNGIFMDWNEFTGTIPEVYGLMKPLIGFSVHRNFLTGTVPQNLFGDMRYLRTLNVGRNFLTGTIPTSINKMVNLQGLFLFSNAFHGQIPDGIGDLSLLTFVRLDKNFLAGTLPSTLGRLRLEELWISQQEISGTLPSELGNIQSMKSIDLHSTSLNGTIPEEFYNMTDLQDLDLSDTGLSGTLSTNIGRLTDLRILRINGNQLSGELPAELGDLSRLGAMWVHENEFRGVVPWQVCSLKELESLEVVNADCLPMDGTGIAQISCDCCDSCCSPKSKICKSFDE